MAENRLAGYEDQQSQWDTDPAGAQSQHDLNVGWGHTIANPTTGNTSDRWIPVKGFNSWNEAWRPYVQNFGGEDYLPTSSYMALNPKINEQDAFGKYVAPLVMAGMLGGPIAAGAGTAAAGGAAGAELFGPSALELGVPGATGYAAPEAAGAAELFGPSAKELGVPTSLTAPTVKAATDVSKIDPISVQKVLKTLGIYDPVKGALGTNALPAAGLALSAVNNARSGKGLEKDLAAAGAQSKAVADRLLAQNGPTAATAYEIDQWLQNTTGAIAQRYFSMGRDPTKDSAAAREISDAKAKAIAMRDAAAQGLLQQGLQAAQIAQGPATQAAMAAAQKDQAFSQSVAAMLQSMAMIEAMKTRTTVPTTPTPPVTP